MTTYTYRPLEGECSIRILGISPAPDDHQLSGTLFYASLDDKPTFDTLSYTWGAPDFSSRITIDGQELAIAANLDSALRAMRSRSGTEPTIIWADGICINQKDIPERNHQVRLMHGVYSECRTCLIYLGEEADGSHEVPGFLTKIYSSHIRSLINSCTRGQPVNPVLPLAEDSGWKALGAFMRRPWFRRIWIVQEFCLPADIQMMCGRWELPSQYLVDLFGIDALGNASSGLTAVMGEEGARTLGVHSVHYRIRRALGRDMEIDMDTPGIPVLTIPHPFLKS
ncbi:hypothetical protein OQA88_5526 [Cercophora sp. LCS_1]